MVEYLNLSFVGKIIRYLIEGDLILPLVLILCYVGLVLLIRGVAPTSDELVSSFALLYSKFGYEIIFVAAFLEALIVVNLFVPGMMAMALGVVFARTGETELTRVIITAVCGSILAYNLDYFLGVFGVSDTLKKIGHGGLLVAAKTQLKKLGNKGLIIGFINSNVGAIVSVVAGATGVKWGTFFIISTLATLSWAVGWGILIYSVGDIILLIIRKYSFLLILLVFAGLILARFWKSNEKPKNKK